MKQLATFCALWPTSLFSRHCGPAWSVTAAASQIIAAAVERLGDGYRRKGDVAFHETARIEDVAAIKGPAIIGPRSFVSRSSLLRGGVFLDEDCSVGPSVELKAVFMFAQSRAAHFNFIGDSIIGADVNFEAGSLVANHRNEQDDKEIRIVADGRIVRTGVEKFGALIGDGCRIGANAVIAPGAPIAPGTVVRRLALVDQHPSANGPAGL